MRWTHSDRGQAIVEFTLMLPFFLLLVFAIAEFGVALYTDISVHNAASEAARFAAVGNLPNAGCAAGSIEKRANLTSSGLISCADSSTNGVVVTYLDPDASSGNYLRGSSVAVAAHYAYTPVSPLPAIVTLVTGGALLAPPWNFSACAESRLETVPSDQSLIKTSYVTGTGCN